MTMPASFFRPLVQRRWARMVPLWEGCYGAASSILAKSNMDFKDFVVSLPISPPAFKPPV